MEGSRVHFRCGDLEIDYEGDQTFVQNGLPDLVADLLELSKQAPSGLDRSGAAHRPDAAGGDGLSSTNLTIGTIAAHLQPEGPQDLILCAFAKLQIIDRKETVQRAEVSSEMKNASTYFNASMAKNLPRDLSRMVKSKKINEVSNETYSLTAATKQELESKIAGIG